MTPYSKIVGILEQVIRNLRWKLRDEGGQLVDPDPGNSEDLGSRNGTFDSAALSAGQLRQKSRKLKKTALRRGA